LLKFYHYKKKSLGYTLSQEEQSSIEMKTISKIFLPLKIINLRLEKIWKIFSELLCMDEKKIQGRKSDGG
jgi:hypothetical protein